MDSTALARYVELERTPIIGIHIQTHIYWRTLIPMEIQIEYMWTRELLENAVTATATPEQRLDALMGVIVTVKLSYSYKRRTAAVGDLLKSPLFDFFDDHPEYIQMILDASKVWDNWWLTFDTNQEYWDTYNAVLEEVFLERRRQWYESRKARQDQFAPSGVLAAIAWSPERVKNLLAGCSTEAEEDFVMRGFTVA